MRDTLVTENALRHEGLELQLTCRDAVDFHENVYIREVRVENLADRAREIRLFFTHDFDISGNSVGDTAAFDPRTGGIVHYKGSRYFVINGCSDERKGLDQYAIGQKRVGGKEGTFRDAEDGLLSGNPIAQGSVDSVAGLKVVVGSSSTVTVYYWMAAGLSWEEVRSLDSVVRGKHPRNLIQRTRDYWHLWVHKETPPLDLLQDPLGELYRRSLLVVRSQIDWEGAIVAGNDSDVVEFNRDTYSYVWPRDGALIANAMDLAGYPVVAQNFYRFAADVIEQEGYLLHKYNPDRTLASSWHPWVDQGVPQLPIQEDETALVLWALWNHFVMYRDIEFIKPLYRPLIKRAADFMSTYRDATTRLPGPSYDLWEERRGILSFTVGAVFGGLTAASLFCTVFGEDDRARRYQEAAAEIRDGASQYLWREEMGCFCRMLTIGDDGSLTVDPMLDASLWGLFAFGMYGADDPKIDATMAALRRELWVTTPVGGMARYRDDGYYRVSDDVPGNPWFVCTLWFAEYLIARSRNEAGLDEAQQILSWVAQHARPSGILAEQLDPITGEPLSISPLTWSHATFVATTQRLLQRLGRLRVCPECGRIRSMQERSNDWIGRLYADRCDSIHGICQVE